MMTFEITNPKTHQRLKVGGKDFDDVARIVKILFQEDDNRLTRYRVDRNCEKPTIWLHVNRKMWAQLCPVDTEAKQFVEDTLLLIDRPINNDVAF